MNVISLTDFMSGAWASLIQIVTDFMGRHVWYRRVSANGEGTWVYQVWQEYASNTPVDCTSQISYNVQGYEVKLYKMGRIVYFSYLSIPYQTVANTQVTLCTLPSTCRPLISHHGYQHANNYAVNSGGYYVINSINGAVNFLPEIAINARICLSACFISAT